MTGSNFNEPSPRRAMMRWLCIAAAASSTVLAAAPAGAIEPWSDPDPPEPPQRYSIGHFGFRAGAEYRAQLTYINPIALNSTASRRAGWIDHRLRLGGTVDYQDKVKISTSFDIMDGVIWGDNGFMNETPSSNRGTNVGVKSPNAATPCIGLRGEDALDPESYGFVLCDQQYFRVRRLYGEVALPVGVLRVGRMPVNIGIGINGSDGEGRQNRFGISRTGDISDRILFATKPLEAFKLAKDRDTSENSGMFVILAYDRMVTDSPQLFGDDVNQWDTAVRFLAPKYKLGSDLLLAGVHVYRWDSQFNTAVHSLGLRAASRFGSFHVGVDVAANFGSTREISTAYKPVTNDPVVDQPIRQVGARAVVRFDRPKWSAYMEVDYASGDRDPTNQTPLTQYLFSEDANVGLLLFEHVLSFQTARAAAASNEILRRLGGKILSPDAVNTRGAFTNAFAIFPQVDVRPTKTLLIRAGVLAAWAPAPLVDPSASLQARDGVTIEDDLVNYAGGKPASYYGTEIDWRLSWRLLNHFVFDFEGAVLFPGAALADENGDAVRSVLLQGRTSFFF
jgi:hypothetical protein